jgi:hypothetical protein
LEEGGVLKKKTNTKKNQQQMRSFDTFLWALCKEKKKEKKTLVDLKKKKPWKKKIHDRT